MENREVCQGSAEYYRKQVLAASRQIILSECEDHSNLLSKK